MKGHHSCRIAVLAALMGVSHLLWADDYSQLQAWFAKPETARGEVPSAVKGVLKKPGDVKTAADKVWQIYQAGAVALGWAQDLPAPPPALETIKTMPADQRPKPAQGVFTDSGKEMPFYLLAKGARGTNGWPLFISMHGGGMDPDANGPHGSAMNDSEWQAQVRLFETIYPSGLYFLPRMADDHDGRWWYAYVQAIYDRAIRRAILFRDVDPNRVYVMGISEGGYAGYRLGAHMADRWAGSCAMAAAEPMDTSPPENFRNLPFRCGIGELDSLYNRINLARNYFAKLDALKQSDGAPDAYVHFFDEQKGKGHHIDYQPGPLWLADFVRNPWPARVVWTVQPLNNVVRQQMYWLALDAEPQQLPLFLSARVEKNVVTVTAEQNAGDHQRIAATNVSLRIYLNDTLADLDQPVKFVVNGKTVFDGKVKRTVATLARSLNERGDPCYMFPAEIPVKL
jgi:hypothetical protein